MVLKGLPTSLHQPLNLSHFHRRLSPRWFFSAPHTSSVVWRWPHRRPGPRQTQNHSLSPAPGHLISGFWLPLPAASSPWLLGAASATSVPTPDRPATKPAPMDTSGWRPGRTAQPTERAAVMLSSYFTTNLARDSMWLLFSQMADVTIASVQPN